MKHLLNFLTLVSFLSLVLFIGCKTKKVKKDPPTKAITDALTATAWVPVTNGVLVDGTPREEWVDFSLSFTVNGTFDGGTFATTGLPTEEDAKLVWPASGTWQFATDAEDEIVKDEIIRDDGVIISLTVSVNDPLAPTTGTLSLGFSVPDPNARVEGFYGEWSFRMGLPK